jgi:hypothetical protein
MKKVILLLMLLPFFTSASFAQNETFSKGTSAINLGVGVGSFRSFPLTASYELGIIDGILDKGTIGVGGIVGFRTYTSVGYRYTSYSFGVRAAFHYYLVENLDVYAGAMVGFSYYSAYYGVNPNQLFPGAYVGARYYFSPNFGVMVEAGAGISNINGGIVFKF